MSDYSYGVQMTPAICTQCGASVEVDPKQEAAVCKSCNTPFIVSKAISNYSVQHATVEHVDSINIVKTGAVQAAFNFADKQITRKAEEKKRKEEEARIQSEKNMALLKKYWWAIAALVVVFIIIIAIGINSESKDSAGKISVGVSSSELAGKNYEEVVSTLQKAGFTSIETEVLDDLITGWLKEDGEVEEVKIDGKTSFSRDSKFDEDAKIVVVYHTFPESEETSPNTSEGQAVVTDESTTAPTTIVESESEATVATEASVYEFAYKKAGPEYTLYYLIDTDEKVVRYFSTNDTGVMVGTYTGDLDKGIDILYTGGDMHEQIQFENASDDSSIILTDPSGFEWVYVKTEVSEAEEILNQDGYQDITSY